LRLRPANSLVRMADPTAGTYPCNIDSRARKCWLWGVLPKNACKRGNERSPAKQRFCRIPAQSPILHRRYKYPDCDQNAWAKPEAVLICGECYEDGEGEIFVMEAEG
jgi:hypothetical protein